MSRLSFNAVIHAERLPDNRIRITVDLNGNSYEIGHIVPNTDDEVEQSDGRPESANIKSLGA